LDLSYLLQVVDGSKQAPLQAREDSPSDALTELARARAAVETLQNKMATKDAQGKEQVRTWKVLFNAGCCLGAVAAGCSCFLYSTFDIQLSLR
jgi:hypothetical protein